MDNNIFEKIKKVNEYQSEYWSARELADALSYVDYRNFTKVIEKAKVACENSWQDIHNHFVDTNEMVKIGSGAERMVDTVYLSRYACYLIIQNSDPSKEEPMNRKVIERWGQSLMINSLLKRTFLLNSYLATRYASNA